jgi:hypothetical protein
MQRAMIGPHSSQRPRTLLWARIAIVAGAGIYAAALTALAAIPA